MKKNHGIIVILVGNMPLKTKIALGCTATHNLGRTHFFVAERVARLTYKPSTRGLSAVFVLGRDIRMKRGEHPCSPRYKEASCLVGRSVYSFLACSDRRGNESDWQG